MQPTVVVCLVVMNKKLEILLGKRRVPPPEDGLYGFPGGKLEFGEMLEQACRRELFDETDLVMFRGGTFLGYIEAVIPDVGHFIEMFYIVDNYTRKVVNKESEKCYGWEWFPLDNLPKEQTVGLKKFEQQLLPWLKRML